MPIEIKELHIKVTVNAPGGGPAPSAAAPVGGAPADKEALVAECVEQVLLILQQKQER